MSHIFISYSSKDRPKTKALADILEKKGWKVWWDKNLKPGKAFDHAISKALDEAGCIVVLWSKNSVESS
ncbi:MAG: toll/interleukin-1 receptor domain-containing protein [Lewinellaceae bacterium]|nr:toll/interleukin-1 receptor domain-containing protein [Phaeodactylibacter sp.]MCB9036416.1 toll/interleukin-1 receptor domain-containing protein [Lewinellaceae bacterium]